VVLADDDSTGSDTSVLSTFVSGRKGRRAYSRIRQGLEVGQLLGEAIRWVVLTSAPESPVDIHDSFRKLVWRVRRGPSPAFEYAVTGEVGKLHGMRHLNVLWRGEFIAQKWLDDQWWECHRSRHVHVELVQSSGAVAGYVAKYVTKDPTMKRGIWCSRGWLGTGEVGEVAAACRSRGRWDVWRHYLEGGEVVIDQVRDEKAALLLGVKRWRVKDIRASAA
jgi:hypothetical protein